MLLKITGDPGQGGLPNGASVKVYEANGVTNPQYPIYREVSAFHRVTGGVVHVDVDPGKYRITIWKSFGARQCMSYCYDVLVGVGEEQWVKLQNMSPRFVTSVLGTEGLIYTCRFPGCEAQPRSRVAAVLHEYEHFGKDPLSLTPEERVDIETKRAALGAQVKQPVSGGPPTIHSPMTGVTQSSMFVRNASAGEILSGMVGFTPEPAKE